MMCAAGMHRTEFWAVTATETHTLKMSGWLGTRETSVLHFQWPIHIYNVENRNSSQPAHEVTLPHAEVSKYQSMEVLEGNGSLLQLKEDWFSQTRVSSAIHTRHWQRISAFPGIGPKCQNKHKWGQTILNLLSNLHHTSQLMIKTISWAGEEAQ